MDTPLKVFVSSVQKELESERLVVSNLIQTDPFLKDVAVPILYEKEPASPNHALQECIQLLDGCHVCVLIIGKQYGHLVDQLSITHHEYRRAKQKPLPVLAFIKGGNEVAREPGVEKLLEELKKDDIKYKRFDDIISLQKEVRAALVKHLADVYHVQPSPAEDETALQTIEATSPFESTLETRVLWDELDQALSRRLESAAGNPVAGEAELLEAALRRGLVWRDSDSGKHYATAAGVVLLYRDPSTVYPQSRILADAYRGAEMVSTPDDHEDIRAPMPLAVDRALGFVDRNTRHPMRIVGLERIRLTEYPEEALREALVNAVAHRRYEDASRKILLQVFFDRVVVSSPGPPPQPLTLQKLRTGRYKPCSRNPVIAQCISFFHRIEERGGGLQRMRDSMLNLGLSAPELALVDAYFEVTLRGPGDNTDRLLVADSKKLVTPALEARLNDRQKKIVAQVLRQGYVTSGWCVKRLGVVYDTARRDLSGLVGLGVLTRTGRGRAVRYVAAGKAHSGINRQSTDGAD
jgi:ATP-dependent DNA helicase RecG